MEGEPVRELEFEAIVSAKKIAEERLRKIENKIEGKLKAGKFLGDLILLKEKMGLNYVMFVFENGDQLLLENNIKPVLNKEVISVDKNWEILLALADQKVVEIK